MQGLKESLAGSNWELVLSKSCQNKMISRYHPPPLIHQVSLIYLLCQVVVRHWRERAENKAKSISKIIHSRQGRQMISKVY